MYLPFQEKNSNETCLPGGVEPKDTRCSAREQFSHLFEPIGFTSYPFCKVCFVKPVAFAFCNHR